MELENKELEDKMELDNQAIEAGQEQESEIRPEMQEEEQEDISANLPEKFKDPETGEIRLDALINSYLELEKKMAVMMPRPDTDEDRMSVLKILGMPDTPEEYEINTDNSLLEMDADVNSRLHGKGFTRDQVQEVYDLAEEKLVPMILEMAGEFKADREIERLTSAFGGEEKWQEVSRQLLAFGQKNLPEDVLETLSSSFEGVMTLYRMMKGDEPAVSARIETPNAMSEQDLQSMMRDPRYWREKDPSFVSKVTDGFAKMYGE